MGKRGRKGSVTVEAAIAFPLFLLTVVSIVFTIKILYVNTLIRHAITETADEMASSAYIYQVSGLRDLHDTLRNGLKDKAGVFTDQIDSVFDAYSGLSGLAGSPAENTAGLDDSADRRDTPGRDLESVLNVAESAASDPIGELKSIAAFIAQGGFKDAKTELFTPVVRFLMKKYLVSGSDDDPDARLRSFNVGGGFDGLDFSGSGFFDDSDEDIDIVVRYSVRLPVSASFLPELVFVQRATAKAWLGGDEAKGVLNGDEAEDIWSIDELQRGRKLRSVFGANLPPNFPVIAAFKSGTAVMIHSIDLTDPSYSKSKGIENKIGDYVEKLSGYAGQEKPWGSQGLVVAGSDIKKRELLLVIPKNELSPAADQALEACKEKALSSGVTLKIEKYGLKKTTDGGDKPDSGSITGDGAENPASTDENNTAGGFY